MIKNAILVKGEPVIVDDVDEFKINSRRNLDIMTEIALAEGYNVQLSSLNKMIKNVRKASDSERFLFYFTGHANKDHIGTLEYETNSLLEAMDEIPGKKIIVLDACVGDYEGGQDFEALNLPKNSTMIGAKTIVDSKSLAKILYDAVILRKNNLEDVNKNTFDEMKHNWVYFRKNR